MTETAETTSAHDCPGCGANVRIAPGEVQRILSAYLKANPGATVVDDATYAVRLTVCNTCPDLRYGTTCRHCGCLVSVRAKLAEKTCPAVIPRW